MLILFPGESGLRETLRFVEEKVGIGLWTWDFQSDEMQWSPGVYRLFGVEPNTPTPAFHATRAMVHPDDQKIAAKLERLLREGVPATSEFRIVRRNGRIRWVSVSAEALFDRSGTPIRAIGVALDKTADHESREARQATEERLRIGLDSVPALIWYTDHAGAAFELHGLGSKAMEQDFLVLGWRTLVHPEDRDAFDVAWATATASGSRFETEHRLRERDGSYRWRRTQGIPLMAAHGATREYLWVSIDIHHLKTLPTSDDPNLITGAQIRMARALLHWPVKRLADRAGVSESIIRRLELTDGPAIAPLSVLAALIDTLSKSGVCFLYPATGKPAVSPR